MKPLKMSIISGAIEFESLRLRFSDYGLAIWQVLFLWARMDCGEGIGQVEASSVVYIQVGVSRMVGSGGRGR